MCCRFWVECLHGHNSLGRSENNEPRQREYGSSVTLVRWPDRPKLSQAVCFAAPGAPALASQRREKLPCNPGGEASRRQSLSRRLPTAPFAQGSHLCLGEHNRHGYSAALGTGRDPAWGAKKVGEKPSFSPRASGGVSYRYDGYFGFTPK